MTSTWNMHLKMVLFLHAVDNWRKWQMYVNIKELLALSLHWKHAYSSSINRKHLRQRYLIHLFCLPAYPHSMSNTSLSTHATYISSLFSFSSLTVVRTLSGTEGNFQPPLKRLTAMSLEINYRILNRDICSGKTTKIQYSTPIGFLQHFKNSLQFYPVSL